MGEKLDPHATQCGLGRGLPSYQVASWSTQPFGHNRHVLKLGALPLGGWSWVGIKDIVARAEAYLCTKWHLDPSSRLATIDVGRKLGGALSPFREGGAGSPSNTMSLGPRPTSLPSGVLIHPAIWPQHIWAEKWGLCPFGGRGAGSPCNTMWPGPRPICMPSFILIHPTVWPQYTNVTDRTGQTDRLDRQTTIR